MKKYRYLILVFGITAFTALTILLWKPLTGFASDPAGLREWIRSTGIFGGIIFGILNILQVIFAIIPGAPFEIAAGYIFGILPGTLLCDATMTLASVLVFLLVRKFGMKFVELFIPRKQIENIHFLNNTKKAQTILFLFFLIPATPKDVITYLAGLTKLSLKSWIFICFVGRFPAILFTALSGSALGESRYEIVVAVIIIFALCYIWGMKFYRKWNVTEK